MHLSERATSQGVSRLNEQKRQQDQQQELHRGEVALVELHGRAHERVVGQQHDFVGFRAVDLAGMTQPDHVLGVLALIQIAYTGLADLERLEAISTQAIDDVDGRDECVTLATAVVCL